MMERDTERFKIGPKTKLVVITILGAILILSLGYLLNRSVSSFTSAVLPTI